MYETNSCGLLLKFYIVVIGKVIKCEKMNFFWLAFISIFFAMSINTLTALSLPIDPSPYTPIVIIEFNDHIFNGWINEKAVQNLSEIRVSLATFG